MDVDGVNIGPYAAAMPDKPLNAASDTYHHGDLKNALLAAAETLLRSHGPNGLSLREVARVAGVSHTAPYRHFSNKSALLQALAQRGFERLHAAMSAAAASVPHGPEQQLIAAGVAYVSFAVSHAEITQLMFGGHIAPERDGTEEDACTVLLAIIESGIAAGVFRARAAGELAQVAWSTMHGLAMLITANRLDVDVSDPAALAERVSTVAGNVIYGLSR